jgi:competence protein ComEC
LRPLALLCGVPLAFAPPQAPRAGFELAALDVGQGLAVVVRTAHHTLLFDAGPAMEPGFDAGASVVVPYLLSRGVEAIDVLILSHGDRDHIGGAPAVMKQIEVRERRGFGSELPCRDGERWEWDGVRFAILHPERADWGHNNESCVLRVETDTFSALLTGDIEAPAEQRLVRDHPADLLADVLLAPHHGSRTSSSEAFVQAVHPRLVIHSAGWHSPFHHPRPEVVARYAQIDAAQFVTGDVGVVILRSSDDGNRVEEWRRSAGRFWTAPAQSLVGFGASP